MLGSRHLAPGLSVSGARDPPLAGLHHHPRPLLLPASARHPQESDSGHQQTLRDDDRVASEPRHQPGPGGPHRLHVLWPGLYLLPAGQTRAGSGRHSQDSHRHSGQSSATSHHICSSMG